MEYSSKIEKAKHWMLMLGLNKTIDNSTLEVCVGMGVC